MTAELTPVPSGAMWVGSYSLPNSARSPALARMLVCQALADCPAEALDAAELLASELVTNAILHASSMVVLHLSLANGLLRIGVDDLSSDRPQRQQPEANADDGRGLLLLDALADTWGWEPRPFGKQVWVELVVGS